MNKLKRISIFQGYQTKFWEQYSFKKVDPETFSFCVNINFAKKQVLFNICGLMQSL